MEYYAKKLSDERLRHCYDLASPRVRRYLDAEIAFACGRISPRDRVLDAGCGYGRLMPRLEKQARCVVGIDTSITSLRMARLEVGDGADRRVAAMNAGRLGFLDGSFDVVLCLQNGISAFGEEPLTLLGEALRVTAPDGRALFSTYAESFWPHRLEWFERQAEHGLLGAIDPDRTGNGVITCRDGFVATTPHPADFERWAQELGVDCVLTEVDQSSLFCELIPPE